MKSRLILINLSIFQLHGEKKETKRKKKEQKREGDFSWQKRMRRKRKKERTKGENKEQREKTKLGQRIEYRLIFFEESFNFDQCIHIPAPW